jgi:transcriptional regulator with XRE-family HTH domain
MNGTFDDDRRALLLHRLEELMEALDLNDIDVSRRAGLSGGAVGDIMRRKSKDPRIGTLVRIAAALGTSVAYLIGETDDDRGHQP